MRSPGIHEMQNGLLSILGIGRVAVPSALFFPALFHAFHPEKGTAPKQKKHSLSEKGCRMRILTLSILLMFAVTAASQAEGNKPQWPERIQTVLEVTKPLQFPRENRLPLYLWSAMDPGITDDETAENLVRELDRRGIGIICSWSPENREETLSRGLTIARAQKKLGVSVNINATAVMYSFFNGDERTAHIDDRGKPFFDDSFGDRHKMGCPFTLDLRKDAIRERMEYYARAYKDAGLDIGFIWADWEVDGPIEFNRAHEASKKCTRCREHIGDIDNFLEFQKVLRDIRSELQRYVFSEPILSRFPDALVGNYAVYPHNGYRYWYDYFEYYVDGQPYIADQRAKYRLWYNDFPGTGYTFAMPVVYTWSRLFGWYDFDDSDYRWFYNMLLVASNAGKNTPSTIPIISFVHWKAIDPDKYPHPQFRQFSSEKYRELLWHMLLRGTDTFYMWCGRKEYADETRLVHEVYAAAQEYGEYLEKGTPITFDVPSKPAPVISGLRLGNRILVRRTEFGEPKGTIELTVGKNALSIPSAPGRCMILTLE